MQMPGGSSGMAGPLEPTGVDLSNETQAFDFLQEILDDSVFQPQSVQYSVYLWYGLAVFIGLATLVNLSNIMIARSRLRAAASGKQYPSTPKNFILQAYATATAITREASYPQYSPLSLSRHLAIRIPPLGPIIILVLYLLFVLALEYNQNFVAGAQHYTALGVRAGWLACAQLPLLILLVGKNNILGMLTGVGYERLNVLHRWVARIMLLLSTLHFGYQSVGWNNYGLMPLEWKTDSCPPTGIAAYVLLLWINLSTLAPLRSMAYEIFVVQHIITFMGFFIALAIHLPAIHARIYLYIPSAIYLVDRLVRFARVAFNNRSPAKATLEAKEGGATRIVIRSRNIKSWHAGAHVLLSFPGLRFGQNHPATIASTPTSHNGDMVCILKSKTGFTSVLEKVAARNQSTSVQGQSDSAEDPASLVSAVVVVDGPYPLYTGTDFAAFDSLALISASTGVTFTLSHLLSIAHRATTQKLPLRRLDFVWIIQSWSWTHWLDDELVTAHAALTQAGIEANIRIFVTCDTELSSEEKEGPPYEGCTCVASGGKCCCNPPDEDDEEEITDSPAQQMPDLDRKDPILEKDPLSVTTDLRPPKSLEHLTSCASFCSGRPFCHSIIEDMACEALGEMAVAVCGPLGLNTAVRNAVARISDDRAVHKGSGAQGMFLHVESFSG